MRVVVAMSGGVDSSVVAALLHEAGHEVIGVTLQLYDHGAATGRKGACCAGQDIHDARRVADRLGISHYVIDAEQRFAHSVIAEFADSYANGETPVPCIRCNQTVKFADLSSLALDLGAERLATGHYVRRVDGPDGAELHRAADPVRDQSWFLYATTRRQLDMCLFPLGGMQDKRAVRDVAQRLGLGVAEKPDSQDICFVPSGAYTDVIAKIRPDALEPGPIVTEDGQVVGRHDGIARYTVGQGKRLGAAALVDGQRQVVLATEPGRRRVVVGPRGTGTHSVLLRDVNWLISGPNPASRAAASRAPTPMPPASWPVVSGPPVAAQAAMGHPGQPSRAAAERSAASPASMRCAVKLRARETPRPATVQTAEGVTTVTLDEPALPAPGQACVFYDGDRILGGGIITRAATKLPRGDHLNG
jgi:tRNA-uridine 2-sulfurtransferase